MLEHGMSEEDTPSFEYLTTKGGRTNELQDCWGNCKEYLCILRTPIATSEDERVLEEQV